MYLKNSWYVAAWSKDLTSSPQAVKMLGRALVLFRTETGVAALEDRCPHRQLPLSMGLLVNGALQCGYHGMAFNAAGKCVSVPNQTAIPSKARITSYPTTERYGWVWVWMGAAEAADPALIPDFSLLISPQHATVGKTNHVRAAYQLVTDNLMDLSHVGFVHTTTIGNAAYGAKGSLTVRRTEYGITATRLVPDVPQPPLYIKSGQLPPGKNIDRFSIIHFIAPSFVIIQTGGAEAGTGVLEGKYDHGFNLWVMNAMTPETETTTNYFWASVRRHALNDEIADKLFFTGVSEAFEEDRLVLEAQQQSINAQGDDWSLALKGDAASIESRRILAQRIAAEASGSMEAA